MVASSFVTARKKLNSELAKVRDELVHQTSGKKGDLMKLEQEVSLKRVSYETCFSLTESKKHELEFGGRLPHVHLRRYITWFNVQNPHQDGCTSSLQGMFYVRKKLLIALGFEPTTFRLVSCCQGILYIP